MQKKSSNQKLKSLRREIESKIKFWQPVVRNGWWIKFSVYRDHFILLTFISRYTGQTVIRYYTSEEEAVAYINFITTCNAQDIVQSA